MEHGFRRPLGLFLSGGGALGSWQAAALHGLTRQGLVFDEVMGFSIGALNGAAYALGTLETGLELWAQTDGGVLKLRPCLAPFSLFSDRTVWEHIDPRSEEEIKAALRAPLTVISVSRPDDSPVYARFTPQGKDGWDTPIKSHLAASCAIPAIFPPVRLEYRGRKVCLVDGGVKVSKPIDLHALSACKDIVILEMTGPPPGRRAGRQPGRLGRFGYSRIRRLIDEAILSLAGLPDPPRVFRLCPQSPLRFSALDFRGAILRRCLDRGFADAALFGAQAAGFLAS